MLVGFLMLIGKQSICIAYDEGPGGPVNTMLSTQSIYQVLLCLFIDGQLLGTYGISGVVVGIVGTFVTAVGTRIMKKLMTKENYDSPVKKRYM